MTFYKYMYGVIPELIGKWYTKQPSLTAAINAGTNQSTDSELSKKWCYCSGDESGKMIACDNDNCPIQWFHTECLKICRIPKGKWYCPDCQTNKKTLK